MKESFPAEHFPPSNEMPHAILWAKILALAQIVLSLVLCVLLVWAFVAQASDGLFLSIRELWAAYLNRSVEYLQTEEGLAYLSGLLVSSLIAPLLGLIAIARRSKNWTIAALFLYLLTFGNGLFPFSVFVVSLMLLKPSRTYLGFLSKSA